MKIYIISEPDVSSALWITDILNGIIKESTKKALNLIAITDGIMNDSLFDFSEDDAMRAISLVVGYSLPWITDTLNYLQKINVEPILVSTYQYRFRNNYSYVAFNTAEAMHDLVMYLYGSKCKRRKFALFGIHKDTVGDVAKIEGFYKGLSDCGLKISKHDIYSRGKIEECAEQLYKKYTEYDAVVCTNDLAAVYLVLYLKERGVAIPNDIYITGFGNWEFINCFKPGITRMYTDLHELGCQAVRLHQYLQYNPKARYSSSILECNLQINTGTDDKNIIIPNNEINKFISTGNYSAPFYYLDSDIMEVLKAEVFIRNTDVIDREIMYCILKNNNYSVISKKLYISENTIKYRINKLLRLTEFKDRKDLICFMDKYNLFNAGSTGK